LDEVSGLLRKRSFTVAGHRTSVALEREFWSVLEQHARQNNQSLSALVAEVDVARSLRPLASALRLKALDAAQLQNKLSSPAGAGYPGGRSHT